MTLLESMFTNDAQNESLADIYIQSSKNTGAITTYGKLEKRNGRILARKFCVAWPAGPHICLYNTVTPKRLVRHSMLLQNVLFFIAGTS
jgi:hypothetical protein